MAPFLPAAQYTQSSASACHGMFPSCPVSGFLIQKTQFCLWSLK